MGGDGWPMEFGFALFVFAFVQMSVMENGEGDLVGV